MTNEEKVDALKLKAKKILQQAKQIESKEKIRVRKERASYLVKIGAELTKGIEDKQAIFEYLKANPDYTEKANISIKERLGQ